MHTSWRQFEGSREEEAMQQEDGRSQAGVMELWSGWEVRFCRGTLTATEESRAEERETKKGIVLTASRNSTAPR